jgi:hypothetical protein
MYDLADQCSQNELNNLFNLCENRVNSIKTMTVAAIVMEWTRRLNKDIKQKLI